MDLGTWITTAQDLGIPALVGIALGAAVTAWLQGRGRKDEHRLAIKRLVLQDRRAAASATDHALAQLELRAFHGPDSASTLRNEWITAVRPTAGLIADAELMRRIELVGALLLFAHQGGSNTPTWRHATGTCIKDARTWLSAFLQGRPIPSATFPTAERVRKHVADAGGLRDMFDWLAIEVMALGHLSTA